MPDDHSEVVPLLPIPNRTVKRLCADDSAGSRVKVGHRQALTQPPKPPRASRYLGVWAFWGQMLMYLLGALEGSVTHRRLYRLPPEAHSPLPVR